MELKQQSKLNQLIVSYQWYLAFNYEKVEQGPNKLAIWDLPGKENMKQFWSLFYRNINFEGMIYMINYQHKETFMDCKIYFYLTKLFIFYMIFWRNMKTKIYTH